MLYPNFMIVPSMACQASCRYCFGPHEGKMMTPETAEQTVAFISAAVHQLNLKEVSVTFHGGEPLLAPLEVWETLLEGLHKTLQSRTLRFSLQSNLWRYNDSFEILFKKYGVVLGTSIDGPKDICDRTRGAGYFDQTMASMMKARAGGHRLGAIATVTRDTAGDIIRIAEFFRDHKLGMVLHAATKPMGNGDSSFALSAGEYASLIKTLFPWYIANRKDLSIATLDHFCRAVANGDPKVCTFKDCLGMFVVIGPDGELYHCQRFCGKSEYSLGNIRDMPDTTKIFNSSNAKKIAARQEAVAVRCGECSYYRFCKGGCYYNAVSSGDGVIDPFCTAYKEIFAFVTDRLVEEMSSAENIEAVAARPPRDNEHMLLRKGAYISLTGKRSPSHISSNARSILAVYELAKTGNPALAAKNLFQQGVCGDLERTGRMLEELHERLITPELRLNNYYAHITFRCNLRCTHCYASADEGRSEMDLSLLDQVIQEAKRCGFRQFIITGGEPLTHREKDELLEICAKHRGQGINLVLRTNLTGDFTDAFLESMADAFDQVVVSIDGNEETHDERRGKGNYRSAVSNLERYQQIAEQKAAAAELSIACVMRSVDINGAPGESVRALAKRLGVKRVRFRPILPLGRAADSEEPVMCEGLYEHLSAEEMLEETFQPLTTCGIGQNLYVEPDGSAFPCYAWHGPHTTIGNVHSEGLEPLLASEAFKRLARCTVNTISKCRECAYRYLCGGACRAWGNEANALDLNAPPPRCGHLQVRADQLIQAANSYLRT